MISLSHAGCVLVLSQGMSLSPGCELAGLHFFIISYTGQADTPAILKAWASWNYTAGSQTLCKYLDFESPHFSKSTNSLHLFSHGLEAELAKLFS